MQAALLAAARRLRIVHGREIAVRGPWWEEHLLILAAPRRLVMLGRRFRQLAIVVVARGQPARLVLL